MNLQITYLTNYNCWYCEVFCKEMFVWDLVNLPINLFFKNVACHSFCSSGDHLGIKSTTHLLGFPGMNTLHINLKQIFLNV